MIPRLYEKGTTSFTTLGIGALSEATQCLVTEVVNDEYTLELTYPVTGKYINELVPPRIIYALHDDSEVPQPFEIYKVTRPIQGIVTVYANHVRYRANYIPLLPNSGSTVNAIDAMNTIAAQSQFVACPFVFSSDVVKPDAVEYKFDAPLMLSAALWGGEGSIADLFGGEFEFDNYNIVLHKNRGADRGVMIKYGKNLSDVSQEISLEDTYTSIVPYYRNQDSYIFANPAVINTDNYADFPYQRALLVDATSVYEEVPTSESLAAYGQDYANRYGGIVGVNISAKMQLLSQTLDYADLAGTEIVRLCDTVTVYHPALGISTKAKIIKTVYDTLLERYDSVEIGTAKQTFADTIAKLQRRL